MGDDRKIVPFAGFVVATLLGLLLVVLDRWKARTYVWKWWIAGLLFMCIAIRSFFYYDDLISRWTETFGSTRVVIGNRWTEIGTKAHGGLSVSDLLENFGGQADLLWDKTELEARRRAIAVVYLECVIVSTLTIISVIQALQCSDASADPANIQTDTFS
jgi:hypothetical protein